MSSNIRIIVGCMTFGPAHSSTARVTSLDETKTIFNYFYDQGYGEIDTSSAAGYKNDFNFHVATKCYPAKPGMHTASELPGYLNKSLAELKTDCIDIFYLHAPDRKLYKEGKFKIFGLSNYTAYEVAEIVTLAGDHGLVQPTIYQGRYNVMSPDIPRGGRFSSNTAQGALYRSRYFKDAYWDAIQLIQPLAEKHGLTLLEIALRWLVHHSQLKFAPGKELAGDGIIVGVSSLKQLEDNINAIEGDLLPSDVVEALDIAWKIVKPDVAPYWNGKLVYSYDE
ncbi:NADP-dependent oxidoreductase domain-containing protein [Lipomyces starkeyi]